MHIQSMSSITYWMEVAVVTADPNKQLSSAFKSGFLGIHSLNYHRAITWCRSSQKHQLVLVIQHKCLILLWSFPCLSSGVFYLRKFVGWPKRNRRSRGGGPIENQCIVKCLRQLKNCQRRTHRKSVHRKMLEAT